MLRKENKKNKPKSENIIDVSYVETMGQSYVDYSMSVITARAVPDIRDGLKPVQRRAIYDMHSIGATSDKPYRKSARIAGDVIGRFHPHGSDAVYESIVVLAQNFKKEQPLIDGHGNFGSIEGDGAAAMRYTEARLEKFTEDVFLSDINSDTVDFVPNYDETETEPAVLPCKLPHFLINGSEGIAVGMVTSTPTHNVGEVIDTAISYINNPKQSTAELLQTLHGPDFPTGGIVANADDLESIYETGQGKLRIRGKVEIEKGAAGKTNIVVTEIPYTMIGSGIGKFLQDVAALAEDRTVPEISDILNQTSKEGTRIVIELKKGAEKDIDRIVNILYKKTRLEDTFGVNMLAIHDRKPETMTLKSCLAAYYEFQKELLYRKAKYLLDRARKKNEIDEGLVKAVECIDTIIEVLRGSDNLQMARLCLTDGVIDGIAFKTKSARIMAAKFAFTEAQATAILEMKLSRLIKLELAAILKDIKELESKIKYYESIINDKNDRVKKKEIIKMLEEMKKKYSVPRKTKITNLSQAVIEEREEPETPLVLLMDRFAYIHSVDAGIYEKNKDNLSEYRLILPTTSKSKIVLFTDMGKVHTVKVSDIPGGKLRDKGQPLDNICNYDSRSENILSIFALDGAAEREIVFVNSAGLVKRVILAEFDVTRKTMDATKLAEGEELVAVFEYDEKGQVILHSEGGMFIRFSQSEMPLQKRGAAGAKGLLLKDGDRVDKAVPLSGASDSFTWNDKEYDGTRIKPQKRGGKGVKAAL